MSEIIDNSISQYAKLHNIPMYEVSDLRGTIIVLKNETDYLTLLKKNNVGALFFSYSVTDDSDEIDADIDYEEVQHQLEEDDFFKCKTKDARTMYLEEFVNLHYPHLRELMNHPNSFKKIPDFYFSFDRSRRSFYASQIFDSINESK